MIVAYLMPNDANDPRDGIGFIAAAPTQEEAIEKLKLQFQENYGGEEVEFHLDNPKERPHFIAHWKSEDDGVRSSEFYWFHTAED
jgi:hypothetical protein